MFGRRERELLQAQIDERSRERDEARVELEHRTSEPLEQAIGKSIVVHCDDRRSVAGVLTGIYDASITLEGARLLVEGAGAIAQDGTIVVPRKRVGWYQLGITIDDARLPA
jgi:hypothetical protein